nr:MAG TPA: BppU domain protein [Caudoviricetes sp.]
MQILKMDFQSQSAPPVVPVMQSDAQSRFIGMALYNGGTPYKAPEGAVYTVQYRGEGANNFGWYDQILTTSGKHAAVTVDADNAHIITLELAEQALRRPGDVHVNLCVMGPDTGYELRTFDIIVRVGGAAYPDDVAVQSYFFVTGVSSSSWLSYVSTCLEAQQAAEKAVTLAENSATTAKKAAVSASADAKNAQDNASSAKEAADRITFIANGCKGYYSTAQDLRDAYPTAAAGSWAIVAENSTIWVWNPATSAWKDASVNVDFSDYYKKSEADAKFGTPYSLPPATADQLGGVKVGEALDIAPDGTLSAKTLNDKIAAAVAVKSEPRLVWSGKTTIGRRKTQTINVQDGVDYVNLRVTCGADESDFNLTPGMSYETGGLGAGSLTVTVLFSADKKRLECTLTNTLNTVSVVFTGYHYPTLAELVAETQAAQDDADALNLDQDYRLTLLELGVTDDETTETA